MNFFGAQSEIDSHWLIGLRYLRYRDSSPSKRLDSGLATVDEETPVARAVNDAFRTASPGVGLDLGAAQHSVAPGPVKLAG